MKIINALIVSTILISCNSNKQPITNQPLNQKEELTKSDSNISLSVLKGNYEVVIGQQMEYTSSVHGSVGSTSEVYSMDETIVQLVDKKFKYDDPSKSELNGGDAGAYTYTFKAIASGETDIKVINLFRGDTIDTYQIKILVQ